MEPTSEVTEYFIRLTLLQTEGEPRYINVVIPEDVIESLLNNQGVEFDIIRKITIIEETSVTDIKKKD